MDTNAFPLAQCEHCAGLILAAGRGTRMHSSKPKVLQTLLGEPMLRYVHTALQTFFGNAVWAVVGYGEDQVRQIFADQSLHFVEQKEQLGTGHALLTALPILRAAGMQQVLLVNGDTPLISPDILSSFLEKSAGSDISVATLELPDPSAYGRIVRNSQGKIAAIVEAKDYDPAKYGADPHEINAGVYLLNLLVAEKLLPF